VLLMDASLGRRLVAEATGTALLVATVVGSGIAAERLSPGDVGLQLLENSMATAGALAALILAFGAISGAHFNPVVSLADRVFGHLSTGTLAAYTAAQVVGACAGAVVANLMFDLDAVSISARDRTGSGLWLGELVATLGLVLVIIGCVRASRTDAIAWAVAGWIVAAYWFTSSTSFANPAVTIARTLSDTFAGISPASVPMFVLMQVVGGALALGILRLLHPTPSPLEAPRD
jgi:glycerol uptake facilitator-like aquaporin